MGCARGDKKRAKEGEPANLAAEEAAKLVDKGEARKRRKRGGCQAGRGGNG